MDMMMMKMIYALICTRSLLCLMRIIFGNFFNKVMALDRHQNFVYAQYLVN